MLQDEFIKIVKLERKIPLKVLKKLMTEEFLQANKLEI